MGIFLCQGGDRDLDALVAGERPGQVQRWSRDRNRDGHVFDDRPDSGFHALEAREVLVKNRGSRRQIVGV